MNVFGRHYRTIWVKEGESHIVQIIDQRHLPHKFVIEDLSTVDQVALAIEEMHVRGAGLIVSKRGKQGGYALARAPGKISLTQIVEAVDCELLERNFEDSGHSGARVASIWSDVGECFEAKVRAYTLDDFIVKDADVEMYYI